MSVCDDDGMDTGTHLRAIWRRRGWIIAGAVLVGLAVLLLRMAAPSTYTAQATLFLVLGEREANLNDGSLRRLTAAYVQLRNDESVIADAARRAGEPASALAASVSTSSGVDGQVVVTASRPTAQEAAVVANAFADAVSNGARRDQIEAQRRELAPLDAELQATRQQLEELPPGSSEAQQLESRAARAEQARIDRLAAPRTRLDVVERAQPREAVRTPRPRRDAGLAFVLALILLSELAALRAARRQALEGPDAVAALEEWTTLPVFRVGATKSSPDETAAAVRFLRSDSPAPERLIALAPLAPLDASPASKRAIAEFVGAVAEAEGSTTWLDLDGSGALGDRSTAVVHRVEPDIDEVRRWLRPGATAVASAEAWESPALVRLGEVAPVVAALVVDAGAARRKGFEEAVRVLGLAAVQPVAVLVVEPPRRWRRAAAGADGPSRAAEESSGPRLKSAVGQAPQLSPERGVLPGAAAEGR